MAKFIPGQTKDVSADEPTLEVLADLKNPLKVGKHVFELVVTDDSGNQSEPATVTIVVLDKERPTAVIDLINAAGQRISRPTVELALGERFVLTGERSSDVGGVVKSYHWKLLQA